VNKHRAALRDKFHRPLRQPRLFLLKPALAHGKGKRTVAAFRDAPQPAVNPPRQITLRQPHKRAPHARRASTDKFHRLLRREKFARFQMFQNILFTSFFHDAQRKAGERRGFFDDPQSEQKPA